MSRSTHLVKSSQKTKPTRAKRIIAFVFGVGAVVLFIMNAILLWAYTGPRSIAFLTPYIEASALPPSSGYKLEVQDPQLFFNGWQHPLGVKTPRVEVMDKTGRVVANFSDIFIQLSLPYLAVGIVHPTAVRIEHPYISLYQKSDGSIGLGLAAQEPANPTSNANDDMVNLLAAFTQSKFDNFEINNARLSVSNKNGVFLQSTNTQITLHHRRFRGIQGNITIDLLYNNLPSRIDVDVSTPRGGSDIRADIVFTDIYTGMIASAMPAQKWITAADMPLSGWGAVMLSSDGKIKSTEIGVEGGPGLIDIPEQFDKPLLLKHVKLNAASNDQFKTVNIKEIAADLNGTKLHFKGTIAKVGDDYGIEGTGGAENLLANNLKLYWPKTLSKQSRAWVTSNITKGFYKKAVVKVNVKPGDLKLPNLPDKDVDATIELENASVRYLPDHPQVTGVSGVGHITGMTMTVEATSGNYMKGTSITRARLHCPDLNAADTRMVMDMDANTIADDVVEFLGLPELNKAKDLNLTSAASGKGKANVKLDFIAFSDSPVSHPFKYDIDAQLDHVSQPGFMGNKNVKDASGRITAANKGLTYDGEANINGVPLNIKLTTGWNKSEVTQYTLKGELQGENLPALGYKGIDFVRGPIAMDASFHDQGDNEDVQGTFNLDKATINFTEIGWKKAAGVKTTLTMESTGDSNGTHIKRFTMKGDDMKTTGTAEIAADKSLSLLQSDSVVFGKNDMSVKYTHDAKGTGVVLRGKSGDMASYLSGNDTKYSSKRLNDIFIDAQLDRVQLFSGIYLNNVKAKAICANYCSMADVTATLKNNTPVIYRISTQGGQRRLDMSTKDAGELIRGLGIFPDMLGGELKITGTFNDASPDHPLDGLMTITEHRIKNAPVLTKILTIASLTGIIDSLSGEGLSFNRMKVPFVFANDVITLKEAKDSGTSIGVTASGTIALKNTQLDLNGVVIPAYALNTILGNIPIIGTIAGGKNGGLLAVNYSVKGPYTDPDISVNPLSLLTPGFLRNVFDAPDKPKTKKEDE